MAASKACEDHLDAAGLLTERGARSLGLMDSEEYRIDCLIKYLAKINTSSRRSIIENIGRTDQKKAAILSEKAMAARREYLAEWRKAKEESGWREKVISG